MHACVAFCALGMHGAALAVDPSEVDLGSSTGSGTTGSGTTAGGGGGGHHGAGGTAGGGGGVGGTRFGFHPLGGWLGSFGIALALMAALGLPGSSSSHAGALAAGALAAGASAGALAAAIA